MRAKQALSDSSAVCFLQTRLLSKAATLGWVGHVSNIALMFAFKTRAKWLNFCNPGSLCTAVLPVHSTSRSCALLRCARCHYSLARDLHTVCTGPLCTPRWSFTTLYWRCWVHKGASICTGRQCHLLRQSRCPRDSLFHKYTCWFRRPKG